MTYQTNYTLPAEILEQIAEQGLDYLPELIRVVINAAMKAERQQYLGAQSGDAALEPVMNFHKR